MKSQEFDSKDNLENNKINVTTAHMCKRKVTTDYMTQIQKSLLNNISMREILIYSAATLSLFPPLPESGRVSRSVRTSFTS